MESIYRKMGQAAFGATASSTGCKRSPSPAGVATAKRVAVSDATNGLFQDQNTRHPPPSTTSQSQQDPTAGNSKKEPRIPAIFIDAVDNWENHAEKLAALVVDWDCVARGAGYKLQLRSVDAFRAAQRYLIQAKVPFHTFSIGRGRNLKVVISGLPADTTADRLLGFLEEEGLAVESVSQLHTSRGVSRSWLVTLTRFCELEEGQKNPEHIYGLQRIFWVTVKITPYKRPSGPPQCHRCQGFGHGSFSCYRPTKCVRCGGPHAVLHCQKPQGEKGECCNCKGQHNANYRGCPSFKEARTRHMAAKKPPCRPTAQRPARQKLQADVDSKDSEDQPNDSTPTADTPRKKRRKRQPRNPENRRPGTKRKSPETPADEPETEEVQEGPKPRNTPRQRIDWPPKAAPQPAQTGPEPAQTTLAPRQVLELLQSTLEQLTTLTGLIARLMEAGQLTIATISE